MRIGNGILSAVLLVSPALLCAQQQRDVHQGYYDLREAGHSTVYSNGSNGAQINTASFGGFFGNNDLPAGWQDEVQPISRAAMRRLPKLPNGFRYGRLNDRIVAYNPTTGAVLAVSRTR